MLLQRQNPMLASAWECQNLEFSPVDMCIRPEEISDSEVISPNSMLVMCKDAATIPESPTVDAEVTAGDNDNWR